MDTVVGLEEVMILGEEEGGKGVRREGKQHRSISVTVLFPRKSDMNEASVRVYTPHHIKATCVHLLGTTSTVIMACEMQQKASHSQATATFLHSSSALSSSPRSSTANLRHSSPWHLSTLSPRPPLCSSTLPSPP